jgi:hypothetical protein
MDTLPFFRRPSKTPALEDVVIAVIGASPTVAAHWATPLGLVFVDGGHAFDVALADYEGWARFVVPGGLARVPRRVRGPGRRRAGAVRGVARAVADGFTPVVDTGSLESSPLTVLASLRTVG